MAEIAKAAAAASAPGNEDAIQGIMNVTKEDQQEINQFARLNARFEDVKDEIAARTNELKNYEDAMSEAEVKELEDEGDKLHLQVGDIMVNLPPEQTKQWLDDKMDFIKTTLEQHEKRKKDIADEMTKLKARLYARFGNNIHLESGP